MGGEAKKGGRLVAHSLCKKEQKSTSHRGKKNKTLTLNSFGQLVIVSIQKREVSLSTQHQRKRNWPREKLGRWWGGYLFG